MPEVQDRIEKLGNSILSDAQKKADLAQILLDRRQPARTQFIQSDEKSDCTIARQ